MKKYPEDGCTGRVNPVRHQKRQEFLKEVVKKYDTSVFEVSAFFVVLDMIDIPLNHETANMLRAIAEILDNRRLFGQEIH